MLNLNFMYQTTKDKKITAIGSGPNCSRKKSYQKIKTLVNVNIDFSIMKNNIIINYDHAYKFSNFIF